MFGFLNKFSKKKNHTTSNNSTNSNQQDDPKNRAKIEKDKQEIIQDTKKAAELEKQKEVKKYCTLSLVFILPVSAVSVFLVDAMFSNSFLFVFAVIGIWSFMSYLIKNTYGIKRLDNYKLFLLARFTRLCVSVCAIIGLIVAPIFILVL